MDGAVKAEFEGYPLFPEGACGFTTSLVLVSRILLLIS